MQEFRIVKYTDGLKTGHAVQFKQQFLWFSWWEYWEATYAGGVVFKQTVEECETYIRELKQWI